MLGTQMSSIFLYLPLSPFIFLYLHSSLPFRGGLGVGSNFLYLHPHEEVPIKKSMSHTAMIWQTEPASTKKWNTECI